MQSRVGIRSIRAGFRLKRHVTIYLAAAPRNRMAATRRPVLVIRCKTGPVSRPNGRGWPMPPFQRRRIPGYPLSAYVEFSKAYWRGTAFGRNLRLKFLHTAEAASGNASAMQHQKIRPADAAALDVAELRRTLGSFATGVAVATTLDSNGAPKGFTANSFTSVSLDPPLVLVCVDKSASCYPAFAAADHFGINILNEAQQHVSRAFASKLADKFADMPWVSGITGSPIFPDSAAWLDCELHNRVEAGDHLIIIGKVLSFGHSPAKQPLGYHRGSYIAFSSES